MRIRKSDITLLLFILFLETNAPINDAIISIFVLFNGLLSNAFLPLDQSIMVAIVVVFDDPEPLVHLDDLLPLVLVARSARAVILDDLELEGEASF